MPKFSFLAALGLILVSTGFSVAQQVAWLDPPRPLAIQARAQQPDVTIATDATVAPASPALAIGPGAWLYPNKCDDSSSSCSHWAGCYFGLHGGWGFSTIRRTIDPEGPLASADFGELAFKNRENGGVFGLHGGYNFEWNRIVLGVEGDFDGTGIDRQRTFIVPSGLAAGGVDAFETDNQIRWLASVRARVGYNCGSSLLYCTGGFAWEGLRREVTAMAALGPGGVGVAEATTVRGTRPGGIFGVGIEHLLSAHWTVRGEYLWYGFDRSNTDNLQFSTGIGANAASVRTGRNDVSVFLIGLTFKF